MAVPYPQELNDIPAIVARKVGAAAIRRHDRRPVRRDARAVETRPLVMGVALHAYIVGQPHRLRHLKRALRHIVSRRDAIWL